MLTENIVVKLFAVNSSSLSGVSLADNPVQKNAAILRQFTAMKRSAKAPTYSIDDLPYYSCRGCDNPEDALLKEDLYAFHSITAKGSGNNRVVATESLDTYMPLSGRQTLQSTLGSNLTVDRSATRFSPDSTAANIQGRRKVIVEQPAVNINATSNSTFVSLLKKINTTDNVTQYVWFCGPGLASPNNLQCAGNPLVDPFSSSWTATPGS